ncbi:MAG: hypothetical protein AAF637_16385 [Pseudomonadota bacterium]
MMARMVTLAAVIALGSWSVEVRADDGLLDLPSPLFASLDGLLSGWLPGTARLIFWGVVAGVVSMALYRLTSNQARLAAIKGETLALRRQMAAFDGPFLELWQLVRRNLMLALRQLWVTLVPAVLASVPVIFLLVWISNSFGLVTPAPGEPIEVEAVASAGANLPALHWSAAVATSEGEGEWIVRWPEPGTRLALQDADGKVLLDLPTPSPGSVVHQRRWWNALIGNPAGYLPPGPVDVVTIGLPTRTFLPFGPSWLRGWIPLFFAVVIAVSLALKLVWRLH